MTVEKELKYLTQQGNINITKEDVFIHLRKMENWKASGPDELHEFLLKKFTSLHQAMVRHLDDEWYQFWLKKFTSLHQAMVKHIKTRDVPNWMVECRAVLMQKDARKGNAVGNYRPTTCLNFLWKLLTGIINENVCDHLNQ